MTRAKRARLSALVIALFSCLLYARSADAWLYPEHVQIARIAVLKNLSQAEQKALAEVWTDVRTLADKSKDRLCGEPAQEVDWKSPCIDFAELTALAADHSCTPLDPEGPDDALWNNLTASQWLFDVSQVARDVNKQMREAVANHDKVSQHDIWRESHLRLQAVDDQYLARARKNNAHFVAPRLHTTETLKDYLDRVTGPKSAPNAVALFLAFHAAANDTALASAATCDTARLELRRRAVIIEAFALHFLEDAFAIGHAMAPFDQSGAQLKGTHDHYSEEGMEVTTWSDPSGSTFSRYVAHGDAYFDSERDGGHVAFAVAAALREFLKSLRGEEGKGALYRDRAKLPLIDVCVAEAQPPAAWRLANIADNDGELAPVFSDMPRPAVEEAPPVYFRDEEGVFIGGSAGYRGAVDVPRYQGVSGARFQSSAELTAGFGAGLEGVTTRSSDAVLFAQFSASIHATECEGTLGTCSHAPSDNRLFSRVGYGGRLRMPFAYVPGDILFAGALALMLPNSSAGLRMARIAAGGGSFFGLRFEKVHVYPSWSWQFSALREVAYHYVPNAQIGPATVTLHEFEFPAFDFRFGRRFSGDSASDVLLQPGVAYEFSPIGSAWIFFLRAQLESAYYFSF